MSQTLYRDQPLDASDRAERARRLLLGLYDQPWRQRAACRSVDTTVFVEYGNEDEAKAVCAGCPVRADCLAHALEVGETGGVWGGLTEHERERVRPFQVPRVCSWCDGLFYVERKPGRPRATCSDACDAATREAELFEWERAHRPSAGTMLERGHGGISQAHRGCKCSACKKRRRLERASARRTAALA